MGRLIYFTAFILRFIRILARVLLTLNQLTLYTSIHPIYSAQGTTYTTPLFHSRSDRSDSSQSPAKEIKRIQSSNTPGSISKMQRPQDPIAQRTLLYVGVYSLLEPARLTHTVSRTCMSLFSIVQFGLGCPAIGDSVIVSRGMGRGTLENGMRGPETTLFRIP